MRASLINLILEFCGLYRILEVTGSGEDSFDFGMITQKPTTTAVFYAPNPGYDPYWILGEWVFGTTLGTATPGATPKMVAVFKERVLVCGRPCPGIYRKLQSPMCVHKLDNIYDPRYDAYWHSSPLKGFIDWRLGGALDRNYDYFRTFRSYCDFLDMQCRSNIYHGVGYAFLHMGECLTDELTFPSGSSGQNVVERKRDALRNYAGLLEYSKGKRHFRTGRALVAIWLRFYSIKIFGYSCYHSAT